MANVSNKVSDRTKSKVSSKPVAQIRAVRYVEDALLEVELSNGRVVTRDFAELRVRAKGVLKRLRDPKFFRRVKVIDGVLTWPGEIDICSLSLVYGASWVTSRRIAAYAQA